MEKQQKMIDVITECGKRQGKEVVFEQLNIEGLTEKVMKYSEDCETDGGVPFRFAIYVYEDGTARISSFAGFDPFDENIELTNDFFDTLCEMSEGFEYTFNENIMVSTYIDEETVEDFDDIIFEVTKDELCRCRIATILLVDKEVDFDEALDIALGDDECDDEFDPADFMYWFEHVVIVDDFVADPKSFIQRCLDNVELSAELPEENDEDIHEGSLDNYIYELFCLLAMKENIEHNFSSDDFVISEKSMDGKYKLLSIALPEPISYNLCYKMEVVYEAGKEEAARIFTIEKGKENKNFLCGWVIRGSERTHLNYSQVPENANEYMDTLSKIYEGSIEEMVSYTSYDEE